MRLASEVIRTYHRLLVEGGPGSGYEDHPGRPGEVGGSVARGAGKGSKEKPPKERNIRERGHLAKPKGWDEQWDTDIRAKKIQEDIGGDEKRAKEISLAFEHFCAQEYEEVKTRAKGYEKDLDNIEEYIAKAPRWNGGEIYRGMKLKNEIIASLEKGSTFDMKGVSSWSSDKEMARLFSDIPDKSFSRVVFVNQKPKRASSIEHLTTNPVEEKEILVSGKSKFKIMGVKKEPVPKESHDARPGFEAWNTLIVVTVKEQ